MSILTSQNPDTTEELKSLLYVGTHRIPTELPHSTKLGLENSTEREWILAELLRLSYSEYSRQAEKSSGPQNLASLSTLQRINLGAL
jgi:hypothetical protein